MEEGFAAFYVSWWPIMAMAKRCKKSKGRERLLYLISMSCCYVITCCDISTWINMTNMYVAPIEHQGARQNAWDMSQRAAKKLQQLWKIAPLHPRFDDQGCGCCSCGCGFRCSCRMLPFLFFDTLFTKLSIITCIIPQSADACYL